MAMNSIADCFDRHARLRLVSTWTVKAKRLRPSRQHPFLLGFGEDGARLVKSGLRKDSSLGRGCFRRRPGDIWNGRLDGDKEEAGPMCRLRANHGLGPLSWPCRLPSFFGVRIFCRVFGPQKVTHWQLGESVSRAHGAIRRITGGYRGS